MLARGLLARAELIRAVGEQAGLDLISLGPAGGESGAAFSARERGGGTWMLKIAPGPAAQPSGTSSRGRW